MRFRWVAIITVWTFLVGPVIGPPPSGLQSSGEKRVLLPKPGPRVLNRLPWFCVLPSL
jgi:hypothetical protein